jgi:glycosyltransferase involved in cell wall biosynthesis
VKLSLEIVIPVLNEADSIERQIKLLNNFLDTENFQFDYRITIAENGSTDDTLLHAKSLARRFDRVKVLSVGQRGVGRALKKAWSLSECDYVGYMDLDFATDLKHLHQVEASFLTGTNCVYGSRLLKASTVLHRSHVRSIASRFLNIIVRRLFKTDITDVMCGFKFFEIDFAKKLMHELAVTDGWFFCAEIVIASELEGFSLTEIPVEWTDDGKSKVKILSLSLEYLKNIRDLRQRLKNSKVQRSW